MVKAVTSSRLRGSRYIKDEDEEEDEEEYEEEEEEDVHGEE